MRNMIEPGDKIMFRQSSSELNRNPKLNSNTWYTIKTVKIENPFTVNLTIKEFDFIGHGKFINPYLSSSSIEIKHNNYNYTQEEMDI